MSKPGTRIELPPEAEPAREFFEALVARHEALVVLYEKRIAELERQVAALSARNVKPTPRNSSVPAVRQEIYPKSPNPTIRSRAEQLITPRELADLLAFIQAQ